MPKATPIFFWGFEVYPSYGGFDEIFFKKATKDNSNMSSKEIEWSTLPLKGTNHVIQQSGI